MQQWHKSSNTCDYAIYDTIHMGKKALFTRQKLLFFLLVFTSFTTAASHIHVSSVNMTWSDKTYADDPYETMLCFCVTLFLMRALVCDFRPYGFQPYGPKPQTSTHCCHGHAKIVLGGTHMCISETSKICIMRAVYIKVGERQILIAVLLVISIIHHVIVVT